MDRLINTVAKFSIFKGDFDYHLIRVSLVLICFFFGYQKWFQYEADALIPYISHGPLIFWMYPAFGIRGATYFLGVSEWLFGAIVAGWLLEQKVGDPRSSRSLLFDDLYLYDHPVHAGWLGCLCRRLPRYDRERCIPDEGSRAFRCIFLLAEGGRSESIGLSQTSARTEKTGSLN